MRSIRSIKKNHAAHYVKYDIINIGESENEGLSHFSSFSGVTLVKGLRQVNVGISRLEG